MNAKEMVDSLFEGYENTAALADFKEELLANLNAKIDSLVKKGMDAQTAFAKASAELGDVSALADELSIKKRQEVLEDAYMGIRNYMPSPRVAGYVVFGLIFLIGFIISFLGGNAMISAISQLGTMSEMGEYINEMNVSTLHILVRLGSFMPFFVTSIAGLTFLGVTQETKSRFPMSKKRAAWYTAAAALLSFGLMVMLLAYFGVTFAELSSDIVTISTLGSAIPFALPGAGLLLYLVLTEKKRPKPWGYDFRAAQEHDLQGDPAAASRFAIIKKIIWYTALGLFVILGFSGGWLYSWLVFILAKIIENVVRLNISKFGAGKPENTQAGGN